MTFVFENPMRQSANIANRQNTHLFNPGGALNSQTTDSQHLKHVTLTTQINFNRTLAATPGVKTRHKAGITACRHLIQQLPSWPLTLLPRAGHDLFTIIVDLGMTRKAVHDLELELLQAVLQPLHARQGGPEDRRETRTSLTIIKPPQNRNSQRVEWDIKLQDRELQRIDWEYYAQSAKGSDVGSEGLTTVDRSVSGDAGMDSDAGAGAQLEVQSCFKSLRDLRGGFIGY
ncbi:hypothetical protein K439DRAFT_1620731 [Ramaria rubella]|nr:hypothetical protein K439DRAFT_1620731 [Ramaria rubella]